jgi:sugar phosphate isomerase/epimerase
MTGGARQDGLTRTNRLARLSLNQATTQRWSVREAADGCVRAGIPFIGLWRDKVAATGLTESARIVRDAGLRVSSLCRGGWFAGATAVERQARLDDNRRAIEEAATLDTDVLVLVCGPAVTRDIAAARGYVAECIARLAPFAAEHQVTLGIEPLHPMYAGDRSVVVSLREADRLAAAFDPRQVGIVVDVYHVWWDADVLAQICAAAGRIVGFHVCDWLVPTPTMLNGRGMMGDGVIELRRLREAVDATGYAGPIEVEIFNEALWELPGDDLLRLTTERYVEHVL